MEELFANILLTRANLYSVKQYSYCLDKLFSKDVENKLLLELEWESNDFKKTVSTFNNYLLYDCEYFDYDCFGKILFKKLESIYNSNLIPIDVFGEKVSFLWRLLPSEIIEKQPFHTLSYADDCLSWGDEQQTRKLYEKAFYFYE